MHCKSVFKISIIITLMISLIFFLIKFIAKIKETTSIITEMKWHDEIYWDFKIVQISENENKRFVRCLEVEDGEKKEINKEEARIMKLLVPFKSCILNIVIKVVI